MVGATLASIRHFCPQTPICLIVDGDADVSDLEKQYELIVLRVNDLPSQEMCDLIAGSYRVKLAAMWEGPFEHYVWLDSDAIVWGDITQYVCTDLDFQIFWPEISIPADAEEEPSWLAHFYFNLAEIKKRNPDFEWRGYPYFSAGAYACRRNAISYEQWADAEQWGQEVPDLFQFGDQGILNYLVLFKSQRDEIKMDWSDLQWSRNFGFDELIKTGSAFGWDFPAQVDRPAILHFCGRKPSTLDPQCFSRPFTIARLCHLKASHSSLGAWCRILLEDLAVVLAKVRRKWRFA